MTSSPGPDSPLALVALIGAPRSGTTWLQALLAARPEIVSPQETDVFSRYLAPLDAAWDRALAGSVASRAERRFKGLPAALTDVEYREWTAELLARIGAAARAAKPSATLLLEKSPSHSLVVETIERHAPATRYIHIVRDGRDVSASLVAAATGWGKTWAPPSIGAAATLWRDHVRGALVARAFTDRYHEVSYEALRGGQPGALRGVFAFLGLDVGESEATELLERFSFESMRSGAATPDIVVAGEMAGEMAGETVVGTGAARAEPDGFLRRGAVGGWASDWTSRDRAVFHSRAGDLLIELGYEPDRAWVGPAGRRTPTVATTLAWANRALGRVGRVLARASDRRREHLP